MADRIKDAEDRALEALFAAPPVKDNGFSARVVSRVRRRIWLRRLALPVAVAIGAAIALEPAVALFGGLSELAGVLPLRIVESLPIDLPQLSTWLVAVMLAACALVVLPALDD